MNTIETTQRIPSLDPFQAGDKAGELLSATKAKFGKHLNFFTVLANSPETLSTYLHFSDELALTSLSPKLREQIILAISEQNGCDYCLAAHTLKARSLSLSDAELQANRAGSSADEKTAAAIEFARAFRDTFGRVPDERLQTLRNAGYSDQQVLEIALTALNAIFSNALNNLAGTEVDLPRAPQLAAS